MPDTPVLLPHHRDALEIASAIAPEVIAERGYFSATRKSELRELGFGPSQQLVPSLVIPVIGPSGQIATYQHRPDRPRIRGGKPVKYETPHGTNMRLDVPPGAGAHLGNPDMPLLVTEGCRKADAAVSRGACCVALLGVWNWRGTNEHGGKTALSEWDEIALNGRQVYVCFDSDAMRKPEVHAALARLSGFLKQRGANVSLIYLPCGEGGAKVGLDDFFACDPSRGLDDLLVYATNELRAVPGTEAGPASAEAEASAPHPERKPAAAQRLVEIGVAACELFRSERDEPFARFAVGEHKETHPLRCGAFKSWLAREFYVAAQGRPPSAQAVEDALRVLEAKCLFEGDARPVFVRMASAPDGSLHVDLGGSDWRAVRVTPDGWTVGTVANVTFRRYAATAPHPQPVPGGSLDALRALLNVKDEPAWRLLVAWLVAAFFPEIAHPVLVIHGEQGSAKSTKARLLGALIDPSRTPLRSEPRDVGEWIQAADHSWAVCLDNLSHVPGWLSDAICRAVTGEGFSKRALYTDGDDVIVSFRRVILLTGIEVVAGRADLLDRSILFGLEPIGPDARRSETEVLAEFEAARPAILGALLSAVSGALRELPNVHLTALPRMADFARVGVAVERALGWPAGSFLAAYAGNVGAQHEEAIGASPVGEAVRAFMGARSAWEGAPGELLETLTAQVSSNGARRMPHEWPKNARGLSGQLRRVAPSLRGAGVDATFTKTGGKRLVALRRTAGATVPTVPTDLDGPFHEGEARESGTVGPPVGTVAPVSGTVGTCTGPTSERERDGWDGRDGCAPPLSADVPLDLSDLRDPFADDPDEEAGLFATIELPAVQFQPGVAARWFD